MGVGMSRWFRFYDDAINDPKILKLSEATRWQWVAVLCVASKNEGKIPGADELAIYLRTTEKQAATILSTLSDARLLDRTENGYEPHNWKGRQFKTDDSKERVQRHREKKRSERNDCNEDVTVTVTPPETEQKQNRAEADARDDFKKRVGNFRQAIVKAFEAANSPTVIETSRAELWLSQGRQEDICLAVIATIVAKKPEINNLAYFDKPIAEAHAAKSPPRQAVTQTAEQIDWKATLSHYKKTGHWSRWAGSEPGQPGCLAPKDLLLEYGLAGASLDVPRVQLRAMQ